MLPSFNPIQMILLYAIPLLFAITVHEVAHGWMASKLGDSTAKMMGRLTLNPIKHIDLVGTILVPAAMIYFTGFIFGWAKPVPVNWNNLRNQRVDMPIVALAGPMANFVMAFGWALIAKLALVVAGDTSRTAEVLVNMGSIGVQLNLFLMVLNLIPIPPLDGSRVITSFLSGKTAYLLSRYEQYGFFLLVILLMSSVLKIVIFPAVRWLQWLIFTMTGLL
jgi:Zn-dependent protease